MDVDQDVDEFLAHYGVKGMKWGVRKTTRQANRKARSDARQNRLTSGKGTLKDKLIRDLDIDRPKEHARVPTKSDKAIYKAGAIAAVAIGIGLAMASLAKGGGRKVSSLPPVSREIFRAKGPGWEIQAGDKIYTEILNTVVSDIRGR